MKTLITFLMASALFAQSPEPLHINNSGTQYWVAESVNTVILEIHKDGTLWSRGRVLTDAKGRMLVKPEEFVAIMKSASSGVFMQSPNINGVNGEVNIVYGEKKQ
jgi:hypothetical protein